MYESGLPAASLIWLVSMALTVINLNSTMARNMRRMGMRLSWASLEPKPLTKKYLDHGFLWLSGKSTIFVALGLCSVLMSWLYVAWVVTWLVYKRSKTANTPERVKEFQWEIKNHDMQFDQLAAVFYKFGAPEGKTLEEFCTETKQDLINRGIQT